MFIRSISLVFALCLVATACTSSADDPVSEETAATDPTPTSTAAPEPTPTTEPAPTSTAEPEPATTSEAVAEVSDEEAASAAHTRWMTEANVVNELEDGEVERRVEVVREVTTGPLLARIEERSDRIAAGAELIVNPGYLSNIVAIEVSGDVADIVDCSQDRSEGYNAAGELTTPADDFFKLRSTRLVRVDGVWLVEDFFTGGDDRCTPNG